MKQRTELLAALRQIMELGYHSRSPVETVVAILRLAEEAMTETCQYCDAPKDADRPCAYCTRVVRKRRK